MRGLKLPVGSSMSRWPAQAHWQAGRGPLPPQSCHAGKCRPGAAFDFRLRKEPGTPLPVADAPGDSTQAASRSSESAAPGRPPGAQPEAPPGGIPRRELELEPRRPPPGRPGRRWLKLGGFTVALAGAQPQARPSRVRAWRSEPTPSPSPTLPPGALAGGSKRRATGSIFRLGPLADNATLKATLHVRPVLQVACYWL